MTLDRAPACGPEPSWDLAAINETLTGATPETMVRWALAQRVATMTTTSFGPHSAATLHLVSQLAPGARTVWLDTGLSKPETRVFAQHLVERLDLNLLTYHPRQKPVCLLSELHISDLDTMTEEQREALAQHVKLEPLNRAIQRLKPRIWITGIRGDETAFRADLQIASWDSRGILKLAPFLHHSSGCLDAYLDRFGLPKGPEGYDPTKAAPHLECGLHTRQGT